MVPYSARTKAMPDQPDYQALLDAATAAAEAGDYAAAEVRLQEAAGRQEAALGPAHPDLANTLNNLAIVCERLGKATDAERCYRRAHEIAVTALPPDHPFVTTSRNNLREFCEARGLPVELPVPMPAVAPPAETAPPAAVAPPVRSAPRARPPAGTAGTPGATDISRRTGPDPLVRSPPPEPKRSSRSLLIGATVVAVVVVLAALANWRSSDADAPAESPAAPAESPVGTAESPAEIAATAEPTEPPAPVVTEPERVEPAPSTTAPAAATPSARRPLEVSATGIVAEAALCRTLSTGGTEWACEPPGEPVSPGRLVYYTRLRQADETSVEHRWYRGNELRQVVELSIFPNLGAGYRTYSVYLLNAESVGDWRVELRGADGALLHEARFTVR